MATAVDEYKRLQSQLKWPDKLKTVLPDITREHFGHYITCFSKSPDDLVSGAPMGIMGVDLLLDLRQSFFIPKNCEIKNQTRFRTSPKLTTTGIRRSED